MAGWRGAPIMHAMNTVFEATAAFAPLAPDVPRVAFRAADWLRSAMLPFRSIPAEHRDASTALYNRAGLFAAANVLLRARSGTAPMSMVLIDFADLAEVSKFYGDDVAAQVVARIIRRLRALAGRRGLAGRTGPAQFAVVLPENAACARRSVKRGLGKAACVDFDAGESEVVLVPDVAIDSVDPGAQRIQPLYHELCGEVARERGEEQRRMRRLTSERERHSRPMLLQRAA